MKLQLASTVLAVTIGIVAGEKGTTSHHPNKGRTLGHGDNDNAVAGKIGDECDKPIILPRQTKSHDSDAEDDNNGESRSNNEPDAGILGGGGRSSCCSANIGRLACVVDATSTLGGRCQLLEDSSTVAASHDPEAASRPAVTSSSVASSTRVLAGETPEERCSRSILQCTLDPTSGYCLGIAPVSYHHSNSTARCHHRNSSSSNNDAAVVGRCVLFCNAAACCESSAASEERAACLLFDETTYRPCGRYNDVIVAYLPPVPAALPLFPEGRDCETDDPAEACGANEMCLSGLGACDNARPGGYGNAYRGMCYDVPDSCIAAYDPVCGCDGETHNSSCFALMDGVNIYKDGPCERTDENGKYYVEPWPAKPGKEEDGGETTTTTTTTAATTSTSATTTVAPPKVEEESVPCLTREDCDIRRQSMNMPAFFTGNFPSKGCFSKNNNAFFSPGKYDEMTASPLPGMQKRIKCKKKKACMTEEECMLKKQSVGIASNRFHVGDFPTKGCFAKNNKVFFSPGTPEEMEKVNLPAAQTRLWCDDILVLSSFLEPTGMPTDTPTDKPTTQQPTVSSTNKPSVSNGPSEDPSAHPSKSHEPTKLPTASPSQSMRPTREGATSSEPIKLPSISPSQSMRPTRTVAPSSVPTKPTTSPSQSASPTRTGTPSSVPTKPTTAPSQSASPTRMGAPSSGPTKYPMPDILDTIPKDEEVYSNSPSALPSKEPTYYPTYNAIDRLPKAIVDEGTAIVSSAALGGTKMASINLGIAASLMAILATLYV